MIEDNKELLDRIAKFLMLHGSFLNNLGLFHGKMGIILFFFHYARYIKEKIYYNFAGELIDEIYNEIHDSYPLNFKDGLCGIAWGIEYLILNNFVEAKSNAVLGELDKMIMEWDVRKIHDISLETGLSGIAHYVIARCSNKSKEDAIISKEYIFDLLNSISRINKMENLSLIKILNQILYKNNSITTVNSFLLGLLPQQQIQGKKIFNGKRSLGVMDNGYAGLGLSLILKHHGT